MLILLPTPLRSGGEVARRLHQGRKSIGRSALFDALKWLRARKLTWAPDENGRSGPKNGRSSGFFCCN